MSLRVPPRFAHRVAPQSAAKRLPVVYQALDRTIASELQQQAAMGRTPSCKAGCGLCCHQPIIALTALEAEVLIAAVAKRGGEAGLRHVAAKSAANLAERGEAPNIDPETLDVSSRYFTPRACSLLDPETQMCTEYAARPVICRVYFVTTDPRHCVRGGKVMQLIPEHAYHETINMILALSNGEVKLGDMDTMLLAALARRGINASPAEVTDGC